MTTRHLRTIRVPDEDIFIYNGGITLEHKCGHAATYPVGSTDDLGIWAFQPIRSLPCQHCIAERLNHAHAAFRWTPEPVTDHFPIHGLTGSRYRLVAAHGLSALLEVDAIRWMLPSQSLTACSPDPNLVSTYIALNHLLHVTDALFWFEFNLYGWARVLGALVYYLRQRGLNADRAHTASSLRLKDSVGFLLHHVLGDLTDVELGVVN